MRTSALAELELAWADGGYHGFSADGGTWSAISSAGEVLTGGTPDALNQGDQGALAGDAVKPGDRAALSLVPDEPDQVPRLERFRAAHPEVIILLRGAHAQGLGGRSEDRAPYAARPAR